MSLITSGSFAGPAGELESILNDCAAASAGVAAVLCHPHPLYGGSMHTRIVFQAARTLCELGMPVLRFNFRGVGRSAGAYDHGDGEQGDLEAAMARMRALRPELPILIGGFSFGSTIVAKLLARSAPDEVRCALLLGLPADRGEIPAEWAWQGPKIMISGDRDEFASVANLEAYFARLAPPKQRAWIAGGDHFMAGQIADFRATLAALVRSALD